MDLDLDDRAPSRSATRCATWLRANVPPRSAVDGHRRGLRRAPRVGAHARRRRGCRWCRGRREFGGRDASLVAVGGLRGGVLRAPARRCGSARTASSCSRRPCSSTARRSSWTASCRRWRAPTRSGRRPGPSRRPAATSPAIRSRAVARPTAAGCCPGQKTWSTRATYADRGFGLFRTDPDAERHRGLTYFLLRPARRRRDRARHPAARRRARLRRDLPRRRVRPRRGRARRRRRRLAGRDVHGEQRTRPVAALPRPVPRRGRPAGRVWRDDCDDTALTDRVVDAWIGARAYQLHTWAHRHPARRRRRARRGVERRASCSGRSSTSRCTRPRSTCSARAASCAGDWTDGYLFSLAGPIYAGTNEIQRNVVAERLLGLPR